MALVSFKFLSLSYNVLKLELMVYQ